jgi:hypothetical protein
MFQDNLVCSYDVPNWKALQQYIDIVTFWHCVQLYTFVCHKLTNSQSHYFYISVLQLNVWISQLNQALLIIKCNSIEEATIFSTTICDVKMKLNIRVESKHDQM